MKEDGIRKLIDYLNESDDGMVSWYEEYFPTEGLFVTNAGQGFREEFILGKRYGFIQRLVRKNKIDLSKLGKKSDMGFGDKYTREETLLMLLAIQKKPIEFLLSILK